MYWMCENGIDDGNSVWIEDKFSWLKICLNLSLLDQIMVVYLLC